MRDSIAQEVKEIILHELPQWIATHPELRRSLALLEKTTTDEQPTLQSKITFEEFLNRCNEDTWAEWVNGEMIMFSPASPEHQDLSNFLAAILRIYVETHNLGMVLSAPLAMRLEHGREPDLLFVATEHLDRLYSGGLEGPADMVVEIISQESLERDRGAKFAEYEAGGVREYWLIDPLREWAEFYRLGDKGRYETIFAGREGLYRSTIIPGFWLQAEWLWQEPLPDTETTLWEILGYDRVVDRLAQEIGSDELHRLLRERNEKKEN